MVVRLSVPLIFSTPFQIISYQGIADFGEWCRFLCRILLGVDLDKEKATLFTSECRKTTAFAAQARSPPSEICLGH